MTKLKPWTAEDEKLLVEMRESGAKWREMANKLDRTVAACEGRLSKLKAAGGSAASGPKTHGGP